MTDPYKFKDARRGFEPVHRMPRPVARRTRMHQATGLGNGQKLDLSQTSKVQTEGPHIFGFRWRCLAFLPTPQAEKFMSLKQVQPEYKWCNPEWFLAESQLKIHLKEWFSEWSPSATNIRVLNVWPGATPMTTWKGQKLQAW